MLVGFVRSLGFGGVFFLGIFGMSVEVSVHFVGTYVFLTGPFSLNLDFR